jgi:hypothetical protein
MFGLLENVFNYMFKRGYNLNRTNLEIAKEKGLITEEEFLRLKANRCSQELENFLKKGKKKEK